jgi:squalene synthase HpnC
MHAVSVDHYENFPVASVLCPARLRPAVSAIYWFARTADDLADEGDATSQQRLADLAAYRRDLEAVLERRPASARWGGVFVALADAVTRFALPAPLLRDLLGAFEQDVVQHDYADRAELLDYCRRSANPVGRLLLHLYGVDDERARARSDAICTALQLANFWQDLSVDTRRGRLYAPRVDRARHGVDAAALLAQQDSPAVRSLVAGLVDWTRSLMHEGAPLVHDLPGRAGWELRLVVQGGLRILEKIEAMDHASLRIRPTLRWFDVPLLLWRASCMRPHPMPLPSTSP